MNRDRRVMLLAAGAIAGLAGMAQATDISGTVGFEGGAAIPKGRIEVYIDDPAVQANAGETAARTRLDSDGGSKAVAFSLAAPAGTAASETAQVVAVLKRADGWLLARGSAVVEGDAPVQITLYTVMY